MPSWVSGSVLPLTLIQHKKEPQESQDRQLIVKEVWNHGMAPLHGGVTGTLYLLLGPVEGSAAERDTTARRHSSCSLVSHEDVLPLALPHGDDATTVAPTGVGLRRT